MTSRGVAALIRMHVTPAKAGVQGQRQSAYPWIPAFAGMTNSDMIEETGFDRR